MTFWNKKYKRRVGELTASLDTGFLTFLGRKASAKAMNALGQHIGQALGKAAVTNKSKIEQD